MAIQFSKNRGKVRYVFQSLSLNSFVKLLVSRVCSKNHYYLLEKKLLPEASSIPRTSPLELKLIDEDDLAELQEKLSTLEEDDKRELIVRLFFYWDGFTNCYVAKSGKEITSLVWILYPDENHRLQKRYPSKFHPLGKRQVMIENVFTFPRFRRQGFMQSTVWALLDEARRRNFASAVCYIRKDRLNSLNAFISMGFRLVEIMPEYKFLGQEARIL